MQLPAAIAGPTLAVIWFKGQFHGVIIPTTPIGSWRMLLPLTSVSNAKLASALAAPTKCDRPAPTCAVEAKLIGAPISSDTAWAISGMRFLYSSMMRPSNAPRSSGVVCENVSNALRAAATALSTSAMVPAVMTAQASSVAGLITLSRSPPSLSTHWPSI